MTTTPATATGAADSVTDRLFAVSLSGVAPEQERDEYDNDAFGTVEQAREWAEQQVRDRVESSGSAWEFHADVVRAEPSEWAADSWTVDADTIVGRATWDTATGGVTWQSDGPFDWDSYPGATH